MTETALQETAEATQNKYTKNIIHVLMLLLPLWILVGIHNHCPKTTSAQKCRVVQQERAMRAANWTSALWLTCFQHVHARHVRHVWQASHSLAVTNWQLCNSAAAEKGQYDGNGHVKRNTGWKGGHMANVRVPVYFRQ